MYIKPIQISRFLTIFQDVIELEESTAGMIENAIQYNTHISAMDFFQQFLESFIATQHRVNLEVIMGMIAVVTGRLKDRIEIDCIHPQILQVIQLLEHA